MTSLVYYNLLLGLYGLHVASKITMIASDSATSKNQNEPGDATAGMRKVGEVLIQMILAQLAMVDQASLQGP